MKNVASSLKSVVSFFNSTTNAMAGSLREEAPAVAGSLKGAIRDAKVAVVESGLDVAVGEAIEACKVYDASSKQMAREIKKALGIRPSKMEDREPAEA